MSRRTAVVLASGGIDSATCAAIACRTYDHIIPIHFQYGQQTDGVEEQMARNQIDHLYDVYPETEVEPLRVINYEPVFSHFSGGVAEDGKDFDHLTEEDGRSAGYVPMRNLHLIATGAAIADVEGAEAVYHGAQGGDEADYPDCRPGFMDKAAGAIRRSVPENQNIRLAIPLLGKSKADVIQDAKNRGVAFEFTYSCYSETDVVDPEPCGACPACEERIAAFEEAGVNDPYMPEVEEQ